MELLTLDSVATILQGELRGAPDPALGIGTVAVHSRRLSSDSLFFALPGAHTDGHAHAAEALANGAVAAVVSAVPADQIGPLIVVDDPLAALQRLAAWWRERLTATVIAVVGSHGKTVTKDAVIALTADQFAVYGSPGSFNSQLGVALAILECPASAEVVVLEAAVTEPGEMARLRAMIRPDHVVFTNLGSRHERAFGDRPAHARELASIAAELPAGGWLLLGEELPEVRGSAPQSRVLMSDGLPAFRLLGRQRDGLRLEVTFPDGVRHDTLVRTPSEDVLTDLKLAVTVAGLLGVERERLVAALDEYVPTSTRTEMWRSPWGFSVIGDIATANPLTFRSAVRTASRLRASAGGRLHVVLTDPLHEAIEGAGRTLAEVIVEAGAASVLAVDAAAPQSIVDEVRRLAPDTVTELVDSTDRIRQRLAETIEAADVVLVQVPRGSATLDGWVQLIEPMSATRLYIDQAAIESNMAAFRRLIGPRTRLLGVVKAHAYGTNPTEVAHLLQESGADWLGVATADEGLALRRNGILNIPILVLLPQPNEIERIAARQLTPLVYSHDLLEAAIAHSHRSRRPLRIHLEVDSGMHRTGLAPEAAVAALYRIRQEEWLRLDGLMTHLGCADDPSEDALTLSQLARFGKVSGAVDELGLQHNDSGPVIRHACATAATIRFPQAHFDMVRVGIGLYGIHLSPATRAGLSSLTPALTLVSRIIEVHTLEQGERVGYGGHYAAPRDGTRVGVVPAGYFDCVPRAFTKVGRVWVDGEEAPIIGTVSMDSMTIDLSDIPTAGVGSDVLIYGHHSGASMPIEAAAERIGTAPYELLTRIGPRVQRVFTRH